VCTRGSNRASVAGPSTSPLGIMTDAPQGTAPPSRQTATVPWGDLVPDILLLSGGGLALALSFALDVCSGHEDYFSRSGAIAALLSGVVAYRSLNKHYRKFLNYSDLSKVPHTSQNQRTIDRWTLALSIIGTLIWAYGDIIFKKLWS
jgi:hypothetical protein